MSLFRPPRPPVPSTPPPPPDLASGAIRLFGRHFKRGGHILPRAPRPPLARAVEQAPVVQRAQVSQQVATTTRAAEHAAARARPRPAPQTPATPRTPAPRKNTPPSIPKPVRRTPPRPSHPQPPTSPKVAPSTVPPASPPVPTPRAAPVTAPITKPLPQGTAIGSPGHRTRQMIKKANRAKAKGLPPPQWHDDPGTSGKPAAPQGIGPVPGARRAPTTEPLPESELTPEQRRARLSADVKAEARRLGRKPVPYKSRTTRPLPSVPTAPLPEPSPDTGPLAPPHTVAQPARMVREPARISPLAPGTLLRDLPPDEYERYREQARGYLDTWRRVVRHPDPRVPPLSPEAREDAWRRIVGIYRAFPELLREEREARRKNQGKGSQ